MSLLEVAGIRKQFGGLSALNDVSLEAEQGKVLGVIGPNGAGKTTLINAVTGFVPPTGGVVRLNGVDVTRWPAFRRAAWGLVRTFQTVRLFNEMTAIQNVVVGGYRNRPYGALMALFGRRGGLDRKQLKESAVLLDEVGLDEAQWHRPCKALGHGERRLVELARVAAAKPRVLCLDEPTAGLNESESARFATWLRRWAQDDVAVVLVSHDMPLVMNNCDRLVVLNFGERVAEGAPSEVSEDPAVIEAYLGEATERPEATTRGIL